MPTSFAFDPRQTTIRPSSNNCPTRVKHVSDLRQTQKKTGIPIKNTVVKLNLSGNILENLLHDCDSMIRVKSGVLIFAPCDREQPARFDNFLRTDSDKFNLAVILYQIS
jgi:putative N-acetylmannosamine-6-phosphate epimerase